MMDRPLVGRDDMIGKTNKYESYRRIHKSEHPFRPGPAIIRRETPLTRGHQAAARFSREIIADPDDDAAIDAYEAHLASADRDRRNAKGHKRRLKELRKDREFV